MQTGELRQLPFETTLMGVAASAAEHYGINVSVPSLYGGSGHGFIINIHRQLCPSGPYCWNHDGFDGLLPNVGLKRVALGFFGPDSTPSRRADVEGRVRELVDRGVPCSLVNMEHQLITGYDDGGLCTAQPWPCTDFPPNRLSYGSWSELGGEIHAGFFAWKKAEPAGFVAALRAALDFALELHEEPERWAMEDYAMGMNAWQAWIEAVREGRGNTHGSWWNARVWGECRLMTSRYVAEASVRLDRLHSELVELAGEYAQLGTGMHLVADRGMDPEEKTVLLRELRGIESRCLKGLRRLRESLR